MDWLSIHLKLRRLKNNTSSVDKRRRPKTVIWQDIDGRAHKYLHTHDEDPDYPTVFTIGMYGRRGCARCATTYHSCMAIYGFSI